MGEIKENNDAGLITETGADVDDTLAGDVESKAAQPVQAVETDPKRQIDKGLYPQLYRQDEVNYSTVSPQTGVQQCANCRWFEYPDVDMGSHCRVIESWPDPVVLTGKCDKWEARIGKLERIEEDPDPMPVVIVDMDKAISAMPAPAQKGGLKGKLLRQTQPATTIYKGEDGLRRALIVTSNGYQDREQDFVYTEALKQYVEACYKGDEYVGDNVLDFEHIEAFDIGEIIAAEIVGDTFLVEVAKERGEPKAGAIWDYWELTGQAGQVEWGASHKFYPDETVEDGFTAIRKTRTTVLPIQQAANVGTIAGVMSMATEKSHLDAALGLEGARQLLADKGVNALNEALAKAGVVFKGNEADAPDASGEETNEAETKDLAILKLVDAFDGVAKENEELLTNIEKLETVALQLTEALTALTAKSDAQAAQLENLEKQFTGAPRSASTAGETQLTDEEAAAVEKRRQDGLSQTTILGVPVTIGGK